ncbi:MAG TPA: response regulator [Mariprofundaceae bacterium]|nr:response regulator [Mariprofundaceae bacterium]
MSKKIKVLVVDDEDTVQSILSAFLKRFVGDRGLECEIKTMSDPVQGLFELTTNGEQYQAILLDVRLPKLSGDEIYNSLEHVNPDILGRIMFVTGYPEDLADRFPGKQLKILQKPFRYDTFAEKLDKLIAA